MVSHDLRYEIDNANAARDFVKEETRGDDIWSHHRAQLLRGAIALYSTPSIAIHKEVEVAATTLGYLVDFGDIDSPLVAGHLSKAG